MQANENYGASLHLHFVGVGGSGVSALAQYHVMRGGSAQGSDRSFDAGRNLQTRERLESLGIEIVPQDGSGLTTECDAVIVSGAVENSIPDIHVARQRSIPILHRSELLARFVSEKHTTSVAGTSGKSTVTAMIFEILRSAGQDPSLITGGNLISLQKEGHPGNAWVGESDLLVIEADESDGSLIRYESWIGVLLNLHRDHKELETLVGYFEGFRDQTRGPFLVGEDENLEPFRAGAVVFGLGPGCDFRAEAVDVVPEGSRFLVEGVEFCLSVPGLHNVRNAIAAVAACRASGVDLEAASEALTRFRGVERRFQVVGRVRGVEVVDDFAHNPDKIRAALTTARDRGDRILAVFQPHGYGPVRFMREELVDTLALSLRRDDRLWMPEIFYAGGTVNRDVSSKDIVEEVAALGIPAVYAEKRDALVDLIAAEAKAGDVVVIMGARDPSLSGFARRILDRLTP
ncbi:MAG: UDP-N-acetylmuramate--alanine ligase [Candidatus Eisenbacteria sp.]|nr:UDP-N-acetylmuramate--alanine ligase [Candidatus Eisenbacteria bacterium]